MTGRDDSYFPPDKWQRYNRDTPGVSSSEREQMPGGYYSDDEAIPKRRDVKSHDREISHARQASSPRRRPRSPRRSYSQQQQRPGPSGLPIRYLSPPLEERRYHSADDVEAPPSPRLRSRPGKRVTLVDGAMPTLDDGPLNSGLSDINAIRPEGSVSQSSRPPQVSRASTYKPSAEASSGRTSWLSWLTSSSPGTLGDQIYHYTELKALEFRLVELLPAKMNHIKCTVHHASLENPPSYVAVSYAWGDAGDTTHLMLDGIDIPVAVSLHGALSALRHREKSVMIWVDALCIDQQNTVERTQQVKFMTDIYSKADSVAVWLGPEAEDSDLAVDVLEQVSDRANSPDELGRFLTQKLSRKALGSVVSLFERDYWRRLWVVQEVAHAKAITVYCGSSVLPWSIYQRASHAFGRHKTELNYIFPSYSREPSSFLQVLVYQGPASLPDVNFIRDLGDSSLLEALRACRSKLNADPRDKVFGILGILPKDIRDDFPVNYSLSVKEVYTNVVDYLIHTTQSLDVICESIHFPLHTSSACLPSWVPDWSYIPQTGPITLDGNFSAASSHYAKCRFIDRRRNKLEIAAIEVDYIHIHGISVGTLCMLGDYVMAFMHWWALLLGHLGDADPRHKLQVQDRFCRTLCLNQVPKKWDKENNWLKACFHVFGSLMRERLSQLQLDPSLLSYADVDVGIKGEDRRQFLQEHFASRMMGRCFFITRDGYMGMGSGFMKDGDVIVVPLGSSTPIILRPEGSCGEYRFVGDVYLDGYMYGKAVQDLKKKKVELGFYVLH